MIALESGDLFEQTHAQWLRTHLPGYEGIWSAFVGNDGENNALPLEGLDKAQEARRGRFSQAHYSLAVTAHRLYTFRNSDLESSFPPKPSLAQYLVGHERLFLFMAYIGHVRDMVQQMESALSVKDASLSKDFKGFYALRGHVIHGPQIPTIVDELSWRIPVIAKENELADEWHKNATWKIIQSGKSIYAPDFIRDTCDALFRLLCEVHPRVFNAADRFFAGRRIKEGVRITPIPNGPDDIFLSTGSSQLKIRLNPSGQRDA
jgi:hypothetical protein